MFTKTAFRAMEVFGKGVVTAMAGVSTRSYDQQRIHLARPDHEHATLTQGGHAAE